MKYICLGGIAKKNKRRRIFIVASFLPSDIVDSNTGTRGASGAVGWPVEIRGGFLRGGIFLLSFDGFEDDFAQDPIVSADGFGHIGHYAFRV